MHVVLLLQTLLSLSKLALLASDENNDAELEGKCQPTIVYELHFSLACGEPGLPLPNLFLAVFLAAFLFAPLTIACSQANFPLTPHTIWHTYPTLSPHTLYDTLTPPSHPTHYMTHSPHPLTPHTIWHTHPTLSPHTLYDFPDTSSKGVLWIWFLKITPSGCWIVFLDKYSSSWCPRKILFFLWGLSCQGRASFQLSNVLCLFDFFDFVFFFLEIINEHKIILHQETLPSAVLQAR